VDAVDFVSIHMRRGIKQGCASGHIHDPGGAYARERRHASRECHGRSICRQPLASLNIRMRSPTVTQMSFAILQWSDWLCTLFLVIYDIALILIAAKNLLLARVASARSFFPSFPAGICLSTPQTPQPQQTKANTLGIIPVH
jgi:hypothetical protein